MTSRADIRYARAFFDRTEERQTSRQIYLQADKITALSKVMSEHSNWLESPSLSKEKKKEIYATVFGEVAKVAGEDLLQLISLLISSRRESRLPTIIEQWQKIYRKKYGIVKTILTMPAKDDEFTSLVEKKLAQEMGRQVEVEVNLDSSIIGGFVLNADGLVSDHSIAGRLGQLRREMLG
ncbi:MAG: ATP synthase F1 subunit delta [Bacteroidales bacterium]|jgi:F-type H+-transporting ATPase subunit delta|nr:ATP synthase F1 subunit delta [Bacteroidales bacterium]